MCFIGKMELLNQNIIYRAKPRTHYTTTDQRDGEKERRTEREGKRNKEKERKEENSERKKFRNNKEFFNPTEKIANIYICQRMTMGEEQTIRETLEAI